MGLGDIREELHKFINTADEQALHLFYAMMKIDTLSSSLTPEEQKEIDIRLTRHRSGESKSHSWTDARRKIEGK